MKKQLLALAVSGLVSTGAWATSASLQTVLDNITVGGPSSVDVTTDALSDEMDSDWAIGGTGGSISTIVIELAGNAGTNTFGIYDAATNQHVELFAGGQGAGDQVVVSIKADGSVFLNIVNDTGIDFAANRFNFYLDTASNGTFYSDSDLNFGGVDHMVAYEGGNGDTVQLPGLAPGLWLDNEFVLGFEDIQGGGDMDYDDFVVMVESVTPVSAPATLALMGLGLAGLGFAARKRA